MSFMYQEDSLRSISDISSVILLSQSWIKESTPILYQIKKYGQGHHIGTYWASWSPSKESGMSSKSSWWMPNKLFSIMKLERSVIHQTISILQDLSISALKITCGYHPWSQGCPPCIRKAYKMIFFFLKNSTTKNLKTQNFKKKKIVLGGG